MPRFCCLLLFLLAQFVDDCLFFKGLDKFLEKRNINKFECFNQVLSVTLNTFRADGSSLNIKEKPEVLSFPVLKYQVESGMKIFALYVQYCMCYRYNTNMF